MEIIKSKIFLNSNLKIFFSFSLLFLLYHVAEYWIIFQNNVLLFFIFQILFFVAAFFLGNWYSRNGLATWRLTLSSKIAKRALAGIILGVLLYAIPFILALLLKIESISEIPPIAEIVKNSLPFAIGVFFTSFSEDILTRGLIFSHFRKKMKPVFLILFSASVYLLNHIYRLNDGFETLSYIFLLGIVFIIPLLNSKDLWITGFMHWAGNVFFYISHEVIKVEENSSVMSYNTLFSLTLLLMIPLVWMITKKIKPTNKFQKNQAN